MLLIRAYNQNIPMTPPIPSFVLKVRPAHSARGRCLEMMEVKYAELDMLTLGHAYATFGSSFFRLL